MNWFRIPKETTPLPKKGKSYTDWKGDLAIEANGQCVYCTIHEGSFGGIRNFHVEHFRPKSKFSNLINTFSNLYFACSICNCFKNDDWPSDNVTNFNKICYPDPSQIDYSTILEVANDFTVVGSNVASRYIIVKLYLNRPQLILERREYIAMQKIDALMPLLNECIHKMISVNLDEQGRGLLMQATDAIANCLTMFTQKRRVIPYTESQITK